MTTVIPPKSIPNGYQTLEAAFDQFGRERFPDDWTGQEVVTYSGPRWAQALDAFVRELEAGRVVITNLLYDGTLFEVQTSQWRTADAGERLAAYLTGNDGESDEYFHGAECPRYVRLPTSNAPCVVTTKEETRRQKKSNAGRKEKADWEAHKPHFFDLCETKGLPNDPDNEWGSKAQAIEWLIEVVTKNEILKAKRTGKEPYEPACSTARDWINKWIKELKAKTESGN